MTWLPRLALAGFLGFLLSGCGETQTLPGGLDGGGGVNNGGGSIGGGGGGGDNIFDQITGSSGSSGISNGGGSSSDNDLGFGLVGGEGSGSNNNNNSLFGQRGVVNFVQDASATSESVSAHSVMLALSVPQREAVTVSVDVQSAQAEPNKDFGMPSQIVIFPPGVQQVAIDLPILEDQVFEEPEMVQLLISQVGGNASMGSVVMHEVRIIDDDIPTEADTLRDLPVHEAQMKVLCDRMTQMGVINRVTMAFCGDQAPVLTSLKDFQRVLGFEFQPGSAGRGDNGANGNPAFALTGHSSSLVMQFTNPINPRAVIFTPDNQVGDTPLVAMGFVRGETFAEIIAGHFNPDDPNDPANGTLQFYLLNFEKSCSADNSCTMGDLLTPEIESDWVGYTLYHEEDLKNTIFDCRQCHQSGGPGTAKSMLMQELNNPWTHWFRDNREAGNSLLQDYLAAHGTDEPYAGIPGSFVSGSNPANLEDAINAAGFGNGFNPNTQTGRFDTGQIEQEVSNSAAGQPEDNTVSGVSATWEALYEQNVRGEIIQVPYHDANVTDPAKLAEMTQAYQQFMTGALTELPDIRQAFKTSDLRDIGFRVKAGLDGQGILIQACTQCHNQQLDQTISRAQFDVNMDLMSVAELQVAIERINLEEEHLKVMPPRRFRFLDDAERALLTQYFQSVIAEKQQAAQ
ncbi:MAG: Calx-beta domain-containing protein [Gammaproteobacteria bacterium]